MARTTTSRAAATRARSSANGKSNGKAKAKANGKADKKANGKSGKDLINHITFVVDRSGSMGSIRGQVITVFNKQLKTVKKNAQKSGQETFVSLYTFDNKVDKPLYFAKQAQAVSELSTKNYKMGGSTALLDAVGKSINDLKKVKGANTDHVSFLLVVLTDGAENASRLYNPKSLKKIIAEVQKTGRWSLAFLTPKSGVKYLRKFGIPEGNIQDWSATSKGTREMGERVIRGLDTFYASRGQGQRAVSQFFTADMSHVGAQDLKDSLTECSKDFKAWSIASDAVIKDFVEGKLGAGKYEKGRGYYELTKPETVQEQKSIAIMELTNKNIYEGQAARAMLGLPYSGKVKVKPGNHAGYSIFVMSTSLNRVLVKGTTLLYRTA